jgi:hypothetical protein
MRLCGVVAVAHGCACRHLCKLDAGVMPLIARGDRGRMLLQNSLRLLQALSVSCL